jgi:ubiquinone/menaquinone biosynthesis C-methylase UbiE
MPDLMSAVLFERDDRVLAAHRKPGRPPFAGQWLLPMTVVRDDEAAEDALRRHAREQFGVALGVEQFIDTVYLEDPEDEHRYVANIFRAPIEGGPMRFNADGDYDDARWLGVAEVEQLWMPPALRDPLVRIMTEPEAPPVSDWTSTAPAEATPLAETQRPEEPAPDNRAAFDAIAGVYQEERYGDRFGERLMWSWRASEDDLHVLGDVRGKRAIVLGCGGGQDCVALAKMGAVAVGVDSSPEQLKYARRFAAGHDAANASFVDADVEDLSRFDDASFDLAVSIHVFDYVERIEAALAEAARVLKPGGLFAIAIKHPFDVIIDGGPPYRIASSYWADRRDWTWEFKSGRSARFRLYQRTMSRWLDLLAGAGFVLERLYEPREDTLRGADDDELDNEWLRRLPYVLIIKARKR